ncbi:MAG: glutamate-5-semialdehyde dehydrogenase [Pseudomonadota bacterium]
MTRQATDIKPDISSDINAQAKQIGAQAKAAFIALSKSEFKLKNKALNIFANLLDKNCERLIEANQHDLKIALSEQLSKAKIDRLMLDKARINAMAESVSAIARLDNPLGVVLEEWQQPNGLNFKKISVPIGVIGVIYEARPNVSADAAALCLKSGNSVILRPGSQSFNSSKAIVDQFKIALKKSGLPEHCLQIVPERDRVWVDQLLSMSDYIDVIVPRGSRSLIEQVQKKARMPVFSHLEGLCHIYLERDCDPQKAHDIVVNAKMRRTGICGALETLLVDEAIVRTILPPIIKTLLEKGCELRADDQIQALDARIIRADEQDWVSEYLDAILSIKTVRSLDEAMWHIGHYGSHHTDAIISENKQMAARFLREVDSAIVLHNASTQFADGGEFGMGSEIGISTGRMHARGPVGVRQLTCYKYQVEGDGHCRKN